MKKYDSVMAVERVTISLEAELADAVRAAAQTDAQNVSSWLANAARQRLAMRGLSDVVAEWESVHGAFTDDELAAAQRRLGP